MIGIVEAISTDFTNKSRSEMIWVAYIGRDVSVAKMGAIGNATMPVHIVGMFFLEIHNGTNIEKLLYLLTHND